MKITIYTIQTPTTRGCSQMMSCAEGGGGGLGERGFFIRGGGGGGGCLFLVHGALSPLYKD